jgi:phage-related protein
MRKTQLYFKSFSKPLPALALLCFIGAPVYAQSIPDRDNAGDQHYDTARRDVTQFDQFLDSHREIGEQLRKDPSLIDNKEFVQKHPALQTYLNEHQGFREQIRENPDAFLRQKDRYDRQEGARDSSAPLDKDSVRFARDDDATRRRELARFDEFAKSHREIAEQVRKDPSLVDNREFVDKHPALQTFLQEQPEIRQQMRENPNAFMRQEDNVSRHEDRHDSFNNREHVASFGEFLNGHSNVAREVSKDPSLVTRQEYVNHHQELREYLNSHPAVRDEMMTNPQGFVKSAQEFNVNNGGSFKTSPSSTTDTNPKTDMNPKK